MTDMAPIPRRLWGRLIAVLLVLLIGALLALSVELPSIAGLRSWLHDGNPARWLVMVFGLAVALLTPISRTALSLLVGAVAGFPAGLVVAWSGGMLGGLAGFALSRWLGRAAVTRLAGARLAAVDRVVSERGFASVLAARIMPVAPFVVVSYAAGLSGIRLNSYLLGTALGLVPWSLLYVGIGASVTSDSSWITAGDVAVPIAVVVSLAALAVLWWGRRRQTRAEQSPGTGSNEPAVASPVHLSEAPPPSARG